jgi:hypothetical protein
MNSDVKELLEHFNACRVEYLVVGGYAYGFHLQPRYTKDFDVWVRTGPDNAERVYAALKAFGAPISQLKPSDFAEEGYFYRMGTEPNAIDVLMSVSGLNFDDAWKNRVEFDYHGVRVGVLSKEDLISAKRAAGRPRDLADAEELEESYQWEGRLREPVEEDTQTKKSPGRTHTRGPRRR